MNLLLVHKLQQYQVRVALDTTFGQLKDTAAAQTGIPAHYIKLQFRGREGSDANRLIESGIKDGAQVKVIETLAFREDQAQAQAAQQQHAELQRQQAAAVQQELKEQQLMQSQIGVVTSQIDQIAQQAQQLQYQLQQQPSAASYKTALQLGELLTQKLIQLDNVHVTGDARLTRKAEINRVNALCDQMELVKSQTRPQ